MVPNPQLLKELTQRFQLDQSLSKEKNWEKLMNVYPKNTKWLEGIIREVGWPSQNLVGIFGEQAAWLIVQHSGDVKFQEKCLRLIKNLPLTNERKHYIAYLTDRILVRGGNKQLYGTQYDGIQPFPIENEKELDLRRKTMGLGPFSEYHKLMAKN